MERPQPYDDTAIERLSGQRLEALGRVLRDNTDQIIRRWEQSVRDSVPAASRLTTDQLRNDLPTVLRLMGRALESAGVTVTDDLLQESPFHGTQRFHHDFRLDELLLEYHVLRRVLLEECTAALARPLSVDEVTTLNLALDLVIRHSVLAFTEHQARQLKSGTESQAKYLSFLSHDLRGGLNGVLLMIEVLRRDLAAAPQFSENLEDLDIMKRSILDTVSTMDRFLHAEKLRRGTIKLRPAKLDLRRFINEVSLQYQYLAQDKGVEVRQQIPDGATLETDRDVLSMVMQNLLSNAIKYSRDGVVTIGVTEAEDATTLFVRDEGPGIAPDKLAELFQPFHRGETHGQGGVGLGLSIARQAADLLKARLWAESEPGSGTTFFLNVPRSLAP